MCFCLRLLKLYEHATAVPGSVYRYRPNKNLTIDETNPLEPFNLLKGTSFNYYDMLEFEKKAYLAQKLV